MNLPHIGLLPMPSSFGFQVRLPILLLPGKFEYIGRIEYIFNNQVACVAFGRMFVQNPITEGKVIATRAIILLPDPELPAQLMGYGRRGRRVLLSAHRSVLVCMPTHKETGTHSPDTS